MLLVFLASGIILRYMTRDAKTRRWTQSAVLSLIFKIKTYFSIHPPCALSMCLLERVYVLCIRRDCDTGEAREDQRCMYHCSMLKLTQ